MRRTKEDKKLHPWLEVEDVLFYSGQKLFDKISEQVFTVITPFHNVLGASLLLQAPNGKFMATGYNGGKYCPILQMDAIRFIPMFKTDDGGRAENGKKYRYVDEYNEISTATEQGSFSDKYRWATRNYFKMEDGDE